MGILLFSASGGRSQNIAPKDKALLSGVNVFLGTSGDHGQLSPAASYPFSMMSIGPQTYPNLHAGYENRAKVFLGFTHNRFEGVGCQGSGGNILIKPFLGTADTAKLLKTAESAAPGYYYIGLRDGIQAEVSVYQKSGMHRYHFPAGPKGFSVDLSHTLANQFVAEQHSTKDNIISGWIDSKTTCNVGVYRVYYVLRFDAGARVDSLRPHQFAVHLPASATNSEIRVAFSAVSTDYAAQSLWTSSFEQLKEQSQKDWVQKMRSILVSGDQPRKDLFYSLLYRTMQSPYVISEKDGAYRAIDGSLQASQSPRYNGWAIWDNYRTELPLLSLLFPKEYQSIINSIADLYRYGKKDYATQHEPSNTVRTEHAVVVLLDADRKGYTVPWNSILDSLQKEIDNLDFSKPDKALESSYDTWAFAEILKQLHLTERSTQYHQKALEYRKYWQKDFENIHKSDVDRMQARGLYQGTIWQYRWFVPFDVKGLIALIGGPEKYEAQLDTFFDNDYYNHANEPDIQVPLMYNASSAIWKSQALMHHYAVDTVVQYYFNDNSRGIDPSVDRIYKNTPQAFLRTMDDDAGAMSAWFIFAALGFSPACVGQPVYYLNVPLFPEMEIPLENGKKLKIEVQNFSDKNFYIKQVFLNGKPIDRNYVTHQELAAGGSLRFIADDKPNPSFAKDGKWVSDAE